MIWMIGLGGSIGAASRYLLSRLLNRKEKPFPVGTWIINIVGSFLLGILANFYLANLISDWLWYFGGIGFCGAFTTFSTFGFETIKLIEANNVKQAIVYVTSSVGLGVLFAFLGFLI